MSSEPPPAVTQPVQDVTGYDAQRNRLPTLYEVLSRRTQAPVDLFAFYVYMRDQQHSVDYLDFWLDVSQHLALCRHYVSQLHRSVLVETPELDKAGSKRSSQLLDTAAIPGDPGEGPAGRSLRESREQDRRVSEAIRSDSVSQRSLRPRSQKQSGDSSRSQESHRTGTEVTGTRSRAGTGMTGTGTGTEQPPRPSFITSEFGAHSGSSPGENDSSPAHQVHRSDLRASAEKILFNYLLPGAEREIILPATTMTDIQRAIEDQHRMDPEVFDDAKEYVYQAMERDAFPGFLRSKALGNLVPPHLLLRLIVGLLAMFGGFWAAFALIFLNKDRATRCWIILPFTLGVYCLASHQYTLDPIAAMAGYSELTLFQFSAIKEPFVKILLRKRSLIAVTWITLITAAIVVLFVFVPGKRL